MTKPALIVPVHLDALVINKSVSGRPDGHLRWWNFNYNALTNFKSPQPEAFDHQAGISAEGIYLHWNLPRALRTGKQDKITGKLVYPLVPNRWLVVRFTGKEKRESTAWVIESDCPLTQAVEAKIPGINSGQMSMYLVDKKIISAWKADKDNLRNTVDLVANDKMLAVANIGVRFPLKEWKERTKKTAFLTAVAPGNSAFSIYYAHNTGVFSMYDDLAGIDKDTVSYLITGWYSDPEDDIIAAWQNNKGSDAYEKLLSSLGWKQKIIPAEKPVQSVYEGLIFPIVWDRFGPAPEKDKLMQIEAKATLNVSIGNTTIDSFSALVRKLLEGSEFSSESADLLRAFQYDLLPLLNKVNGDLLAEQKIRQEWFGSQSGGSRWTISEKKSDGDQDADLTPEEQNWLSELNAQQEKFDEGMQELASLQWQLHSAWWKLGRNPDKMFPKPPGITNAQLQEYLNPENEKGIANKLLTLARELNSIKTGIPVPQWENGKSPEEAFADGIRLFSKQKKLGENKTLKAISTPRYWKATNPVITISGLEPAAAANPDEIPGVRSSNEVISDFTCNGKKIDTQIISKILPVISGLENLPSVCNKLVTEFFLLDPSSATAIAKAAGLTEKQVAETISKHDASSFTGILPGLDLSEWQQPWEPVFLEWKLKYTHIPFASNGNPNWKFNGTDYRYFSASTTPKTEERSVGGISMLSSHVQTLFRRRLHEYAEKYKNTRLEQLDEWLTATDDWKFISQELTGFHERLAMHDPRPFRRPGASDLLNGKEKFSVAKLSGFQLQAAGDSLHQPSPVKNVPYLPDGVRPSFHGIRNGQIYFEKLAVYDKFGRMLWIITDERASSFPLIRDAALMPEKTVQTKIAAVAELPPRLLQSAQLDFSPVDPSNDKPVENSGGNPIGGWIIPNHPGHSLLLFSAGGESLGELRLFIQTAGIKKAGWQSPLHGNVKNLEDLRKSSPLIHQMITDPGLADEEAFRTFLAVIDESLWTIDPLGERDDRNLSVLIGRPLALVRTRLRLRTCGPMIRDSGWDATFNPPEPALTGFDFGIRLGDRPLREDGLIGYFRKNNYSVFSSVVPPSSTSNQKYVQPIGEEENFIPLRFHDTNEEYITLLADPRAGIHAHSGILPVKKLEIPSKFTGKALRNIALNFRMGPLLTTLQKSPEQANQQPEHAQSVSFPLPAENNGKWSWWEKNGENAEGFGVINAYPETGIKPLPNTIREGYLQLTIDITETKK